MSYNGGKRGDFVIKQEENATDIDACVGHGKLVEPSYQNEYLKSRMVGRSNLHLASDGHTLLKETEVRGNGAFGPAEELQGKIESLNRELLLEKQTRDAAEEALKHLQEVYSKADAKVQEITTKLAEAQQKMDQEIKVRDEKNMEHDSKLNTLHDCAKHLIVEVRKDQGAQRAKKQAQHRVIPICSSSSSSSSSSDSSSDESENEYGESSNAIPNAAPWAWLDEWISEESAEYYDMEAITKLLRHAEQVSKQGKKLNSVDPHESANATRKALAELLRHAKLVSKQIRQLESVDPYKPSNAILLGCLRSAGHRERRRRRMSKEIGDYLGMKTVSDLLIHAEQVSKQIKRGQLKRKRALVDRNRGKGSTQLAKDSRAPTNGSGKR